MPRPKKQRIIHSLPRASYYKPKGLQLSSIPEVCLNIDEVEAIRLADLEGLTQEQGAEFMEVSRATFGRILEKAHYKIADAILGGKSLRIENVKWAQGARIHKRCRVCGKNYDGDILKPDSDCPDCE